MRLLVVSIILFMYLLIARVIIITVGCLSTLTIINELLPSGDAIIISISAATNPLVDLAYCLF